jgi:hypothetical protein
MVFRCAPNHPQMRALAFGEVMAPVYRYPSYVRAVRADGSTNPMPRRSRLTIDLDRPNGSQALFVMMNPSKATSEISDKTVNGIIKYTYEKCSALSSVSRIVVLNLYTVYETASGELANLIAQYGYDCAVGNDGQCEITNDDVISLEAGRSEIVVTAWGKPSVSDKVLRECGYFRRIVEVLELIEGYRPHHMDTYLRENLYPKHPRGIDYSWVLNRLNVAELLQIFRRMG